MTQNSFAWMKVGFWYSMLTILELQIVFRKINGGNIKKSKTLLPTLIILALTNIQLEIGFIEERELLEAMKICPKPCSTFLLLSEKKI